ncbi:hypothetical protein FOPG_17204 [Fusarium oxysporum f. sp. conglutinans race 2 54008]|uniref:Uncharacterized protein n=1 Tax=Fusarium oxysporum f. sp. conglutinans race 2 54008 TaxID=1089457 RepID=X0HZX6_FUSOX|nr:hypothetical protein FOPG_17204 [Fusarium oxysporum f. sp. conglutinans race 2 54008]
MLAGVSCGGEDGRDDGGDGGHEGDADWLGLSMEYFAWDFVPNASG